MLCSVSFFPFLSDASLNDVNAPRRTLFESLSSACVHGVIQVRMKRVSIVSVVIIFPLSWHQTWSKTTVNHRRWFALFVRLLVVVLFIVVVRYFPRWNPTEARTWTLFKRPRFLFRHVLFAALSAHVHITVFMYIYIRRYPKSHARESCFTTVNVWWFFLQE